MNDFVKIDAKELKNACEAIGRDWMLITVSDKGRGKVNAMTASWGAMGVLWNKNVCICFVRPQRYTYELMQREKELSIAFLPDSLRDAYRICGRESGRDTDKLAVCGLNTVELGGVSAISEAETVLVCRVLYEDDIKESAFLDGALLANYKEKDYHRMYICEITEAYRAVH